MKKNMKNRQKKVISIITVFLLVVIIYNPILNAQSFQKINTIKIGFTVTSLKFIDGLGSNSEINELAIGVKNTNYGSNRLSPGWIDVRNPNSGNLIRHYNLNHFVNDLDYFKVNGPSKFAVAMDRNSALVDRNTGKVTTFHSDYYNVQSAITFLHDGSIVTADLDGGIFLYDTTEVNSMIPVKKVIQAPEQNGAAIFSLNNSRNKVIAGSLNHIDIFDDSTWVNKIVNTKPTTNYIGRANLVASISDTFASADVDSLSIYDIENGNKLGSVQMNDRPVSIAFGAYTISMIAVGTSYDKVYVYDVSNNTPKFLGDFSDHTNSVTAVAFGIIDRSNGQDIFGMATGSADGTVEIWKYIPPSE